MESMGVVVRRYIYNRDFLIIITYPYNYTPLVSTFFAAAFLLFVNLLYYIIIIIIESKLSRSLCGLLLDIEFVFTLIIRAN